MNDKFQSLINKHRARMTLLSATFAQDGYLYATSRRDPSYAILLTKNGSSEAAFRVTSFRDRDPLGHRE